MPLRNSNDKDWTGWLFTGLGSRAREYQNALVEALDTRKIPECTIKTGTVNMWWRSQSPYIDVSSNLDGSIDSTIHIQVYGRDLWVGRAVETWRQHNYYKRMATAAFLETIDRCIRETALTMVSESEIVSVSDSAPTR